VHLSTQLIDYRAAQAAKPKLQEIARDGVRLVLEEEVTAANAGLEELTAPELRERERERAGAPVPDAVWVYIRIALIGCHSFGSRKTPCPICWLMSLAWGAFRKFAGRR
jgi:hypothetical protein